MKIKLLHFLMASVLNSFNKKTRAKVYGGKKKTTKTMLLSGLYIFEKYGKTLNSNSSGSSFSSCNLKVSSLLVFQLHLTTTVA